MTKARQQQVALDATSYYHCMMRCVRRAFLCGDDAHSGQNFDHRKQWIVSRLRFLSYVYAIDVCAYAVMSNHYHIVLHIDAERAKEWSEREVAERWMQIFNGHLLVDRWLAGEDQSAAELEQVFGLVETWRERLTDISWFMRCMNETIACMANEEDNCKGRFWEGRFKSQALLDEVAILTCMAYVDLNPIRAALAPTPEKSDFTSIQERLYNYSKRIKNKTPTQHTLEKSIAKQKEIAADLGLDKLPQAPLMPFDGSSHTSLHQALPFTREDYFSLVDATGRAIREDKKGFIKSETPPILVRFGIDDTQWINQIQSFGKNFSCCSGAADKIRQFAQHFKQRWFKGIGASSRLYLAAT